jgi:hypothetical protein
LPVPISISRLKEGQLSSPSGEQSHRSTFRIVLEHLSAVGVVGVILLAIGGLAGDHEGGTSTRVDSRIEALVNAPGIDWSKPLHREIIRDTYRMVYDVPDRTLDSLFDAIEQTRLALLTDPSRKLGGERQRLSWTVVGEILPMYFVFIGVLAAVLLCTYLAARAVAVWMFVLNEQGRSSAIREYLAIIEAKGFWQSLNRLDLVGKALVQGVGTILLFAPAYVIAYSLRTRLDTENLLFLVVLAIISNGVLVHSANRLYTLLLGERRKGYVQTALVKGVPGDFGWNKPEGLSRTVLFIPGRTGRGHVFREIFRNAHLQFIPSMKEHVSFIVTGLVIIEMALNIKGHLCYMLLQQILFRQYDIAIAIVFLIFVSVKAAELCIDVWHFREVRRYSNDG